MSNDWWAKKIGGLAQPPQPAAQQQVPGAWWQEPQPQQQNIITGQPFGAMGTQAPQQYGQQGYPQQYNPALAAQMPGQYPAQPGQVDENVIRQLQRIPAEELNQQQMEIIAEWELQNKAKYNTRCPQCESTNFVPAGTVIAGTRMGSDKCFNCGASGSTFTSSPEPARGGSKASKAPWRDVRQIDTGGGAGSMYLTFNGLPNNYVPRGQ